MSIGDPIEARYLEWDKKQLNFCIMTWRDEGVPNGDVLKNSVKHYLMSRHSSSLSFAPLRVKKFQFKGSDADRKRKIHLNCNEATNQPMKVIS